MSNADTNGATHADPSAPGDNNPAAPAASAPSNNGTENQPAASADEMVSVKKSDYDAITGRQSALDRKEKLIEKREAALQRGEVFSFKGQSAPARAAAPAPSGDEGDASTVEDRKAERGLMRLALKPEYRAALDADPTFRDLLSSNPLALLPTYANDAVDAEDAIDLMSQELERRVQAVKPAPAAPAPAAAPVVPPAGAINPGFAETPTGNEGLDTPAYKETIKKGDSRSIADGIRKRLGKTVA